MSKRYTECGGGSDITETSDGSYTDMTGDTWDGRLRLIRLC